MIRVYNRKTEKYDIENVAGEKYITWSYESPIGKNFVELFIKRKVFSKIYGAYCNTKLSSKKIPKFINDFNINMSECNIDTEDFNSFNDFFARTLIKEARPIDMDPNALISPGDGRLTVYTDIKMDNLVQVKNITYSLSELIQDNEIAKKYEGGTCLILRLCPVDYHRFHFIDWGRAEKTNFIPGNYYSVNPTALERIPKLYCQNKREWCIFHSKSFGDILHVEVGATCVGSIIQSYTPDKSINKGEEKGYFKFGGSTTILFFQPNTIDIADDIKLQSDLGFETKVNMGETIGYKIN